VESLPLFPLHLPLFPGLRMSLKIFEPRYIRLVSESLRSGKGFGVVAIREGHEVGAMPETFSFGVEVSIVDWGQMDQGLLTITVEGRRRFRIGSLDRSRADQLLRADVEWLPEESPIDIPDDFSGLKELLSELAAHSVAAQFAITAEPESAQQLAWNLLQVVPIPVEYKVDLLEINDPLLRLRQLSVQIDRLAKH
jgi:Lon protease-like protein